MKVAFFVSSVGDTDLALSTIKSMENKGENQVLLISLTKTAQQRVESFSSTLPVDKRTLPEILDLSSVSFLEGRCDPEQLERIVEYIKLQGIHQAYLGIPSVNSEIPFQIAGALDDLPVLMAYEFMFKPESHCLWEYLATLKSKANVRWALPLVEATEDFGRDDRMHIVGHMSIDNAYSAKSLGLKTPEEIREQLQVASSQSLAFVSSTTQAVEIDATFLDCLLTELPKHPQVQVRLGLHPGIQNLDAYLATILSVYTKYPDADRQFKIILPENLLSRLKTPELSIDDPRFRPVFLRVNLTGSEASSAADRVAQAVPGALLNQAVLEGKPAFAALGKPYLPRRYFAENVTTFFSGERQPPRMKEELGLDERTAGERCADILLGLSCRSS
jgi:hypothetical protein